MKYLLKNYKDGTGREVLSENIEDEETDEAFVNQYDGINPKKLFYYNEKKAVSSFITTPPMYKFVNSYNCEQILRKLY